MSTRAAIGLIGLLLQSAVSAVGTAAPAPPKRVLVLLPFDSARPATAEILQGLETGLLKSYPTRVSVFVEFVRPTAPVRADFHERLLEWLSYKYGAQPFDAICPVRPEALPLAEKLPRAVVALDADCLRHDEGRLPAGLRPACPGRPGPCWTLVDKEAISAALQMLPETRHIALVGGSGPGDAAANRQIAALIHRSAPEIDLIPLTGLTLAELESRVSNLPERTIIYQGWLDDDATGRNFTWAEVASLLSPKANRPMFSSVALPFGSGVVGGPMSSASAGVKSGDGRWPGSWREPLPRTSPSRTAPTSKQ